MVFSESICFRFAAQQNFFFATLFFSYKLEFQTTQTFINTYRDTDNISVKHFIENYTVLSMNKFKQDWLHKTQRRNKLRTYRTFKTVYETEFYLKAYNPI